MRAFLLAIVFVLAGCSAPSSSVTVAYTALPKIEAPNRPPLIKFTAEQLVEYQGLSAATRAVIEGNAQEMRIYAVQLEASIKAYNTLADRVNEIHERTMRQLMGQKPADELSPDN